MIAAVPETTVAVEGAAVSIMEKSDCPAALPGWVSVTWQIEARFCKGRVAGRVEHGVRQTGKEHGNGMGGGSCEAGNGQ